MKKIAFVTACKGRLHHLRVTLPLMVGAGIEEIVVVDYACPDGTGDWVIQNYPSVKLIRVDDDPGFCLSRARNIGAKAVEANWICFIDADIRINPDWRDWLVENLSPGYFYRAAKISGFRDVETWGTFLCQKSAFDLVGGYDEAFRGWGGEDDDLYSRLLVIAQQAESAYPSCFVSPISHDNIERTKFHKIKSKELQLEVNRHYQRAKGFFFNLLGVQLPLAIRQSLMMQIETEFQNAARESPSTPAPRLRPRMSISLQDLPGKGSVVLEMGYRRRYLICGPREFWIRCR
ncbi:MAG: galactosyltransferase-related protein [Dechloromonas sp.]|nr:galactosyltransferase-related protein [Dechloromonas sp.]